MGPQTLGESLQVGWGHAQGAGSWLSHPSWLPALVAVGGAWRRMVRTLWAWGLRAPVWGPNGREAWGAGIRLALFPEAVPLLLTLGGIGVWWWLSRTWRTGSQWVASSPWQPVLPTEPFCVACPIPWLALGRCLTVPRNLSYLCRHLWLAVWFCPMADSQLLVVGVETQAETPGHNWGSRGEAPTFLGLQSWGLRSLNPGAPCQWSYWWSRVQGLPRGSRCGNH